MPVKRPEYESSLPAVSTEHAQLVAVKEQLMEMDRALRAERVARSQLAAKARAEISSLRQELENSAPADSSSGTAVAKTAHGHLMLAVMAIVAVAAVAGFSVWYVDPLHTWDGHPAAVSERAESSTPASAPAAAPPAPGASAETHAFSRLGDAVSNVPARAVPAVLHAANEWLSSAGEDACSVESPEGSVSLVISGRGGDKPLLSALSRCATAVEHFTQPQGPAK
jgi:hypothetical protein